MSKAADKYVVLIEGRTVKHGGYCGLAGTPGIDPLQEPETVERTEGAIA